MLTCPAMIRLFTTSAGVAHTDLGLRVLRRVARLLSFMLGMFSKARGSCQTVLSEGRTSDHCELLPSIRMHDVPQFRTRLITILG